MGLGDYSFRAPVGCGRCRSIFLCEGEVHVGILLPLLECPRYGRYLPGALYNMPSDYTIKSLGQKKRRASLSAEVVSGKGPFRCCPFCERSLQMKNTH